MARWTVVAVAAAGVAIVGATSAASASTACTSRTTKTSFAKWGDQNQYFVTDGGSFETSTAWTSGLALRVLANEPWKVNSSTDKWALQLGSLGKITSPSFCVASAEDSTRFFVSKPGIPGTKLHVHIDVTSGVNRATNDYDIDGGGSFGWTPSERIMLPDIRDKSGQQWVTLSFTVAGLPAIWMIDDVMIDPWVAR